MCKPTATAQPLLGPHPPPIATNVHLEVICTRWVHRVLNSTWNRCTVHREPKFFSIHFIHIKKGRGAVFTNISIFYSGIVMRMLLFISDGTLLRVWGFYMHASNFLWLGLDKMDIIARQSQKTLIFFPSHEVDVQSKYVSSLPKRPPKRRR